MISKNHVKGTTPYRWWCWTGERVPASAAFTKSTRSRFSLSSCQNARCLSKISSCKSFKHSICARCGACQRIKRWRYTTELLAKSWKRFSTPRLLVELSPPVCMQVPLPGSHFPICMSWQGNCLWVGDKGGNLHLVDTTDDAFEVTAVFSAPCTATN